MEGYVKALQKLYNVNRFRGSRFSLENILAFSEFKGNPHKKLKFIHIAGTNAKGTVSLRIAKVLETAGFKTGLYTSPHLFTFRERIQVNGDMISHDFIENYLNEAYDICEKKEIGLTYFEYVTMLAIEYFLDKKTDVVSLETGLGGKRDATNIVHPLLSVITTIGLDHCETLGDTYEMIAEQKAGIIKPGSPVVIGPYAKPQKVFEEEANKNGSKLYIVPTSVDSVKNFNIENNMIARKSIEVLKSHYPEFSKINSEHVELGLSYSQLCRIESLPKRILKETCKQLGKDLSPYMVIFDVGHNPQALERLLLTLELKYPHLKKRIIYGTSSKKDVLSSLQVLTQKSNKIHLVQAKHNRAMSINSLQSAAEELTSNNLVLDQPIFEPVIEEGDVNKTIKAAIDKADPEEIIVIAGSFFIMREAKSTFGIALDLDPFELNEMN